jgi:hypothetical protein
MVFEKEYIMWCSSAEWIARNRVPWYDSVVVSAGKLRKLWDSLSELHSSVCERRLERTVLRPALLPVKNAHFTQFFRQVWRHTVKSFSLTEECIGRLTCQHTELRQFKPSSLLFRVSRVYKRVAGLWSGWAEGRCKRLRPSPQRPDRLCGPPNLLIGVYRCRRTLNSMWC